MNDWNEIASSADIEYLLDQYGGFHDSCLVEMFYRSGCYVKENGTMVLAPLDCQELHMIFHSQWYKEPLELCFNGVRKCNLVGSENWFSADIFDCHLAYHGDLLTGRDDPLIVWADFAGFSPTLYSCDKLLQEPDATHEPDVTFVIAEKLKWRFITDPHEM